MWQLCYLRGLAVLVSWGFLMRLSSAQLQVEHTYAMQLAGAPGTTGPGNQFRLAYARAAPVVPPVNNVVNSVDDVTEPPKLTVTTRPASSRLGPYITEICEHDELFMNCPTDYRLKIEAGFYGRRDGMSKCTADDQPVAVQDCESAQAIADIGAMCNNLQDCSFNVTARVFGTPCVGDYLHYLNLTFACELPLMRTEICEDSVGEALCYQGQEIRLESARWGRSDSATCNPDMLTPSTCAAEVDQTTELLSKVCDGRERCDISATTTFFGDLPVCSSPKYLEAEYSCAECANFYQEYGFEPDYHCELWAHAAECENNPDWMYANCRMTCTRCDVRVRTQEVTGCWDEGDAALMCPVGRHILVRDVYYGCAADGSVCSGADNGKNILREGRSQEPYRITSEVCNGRKSCLVWPGPPTAFNTSDTCPSSEETVQYVKVQYTCEPCRNPWSSDDSCMEWASWYPSECSLNRDWMNEECFQACSGCADAVVCDNDPEVNDTDCDWWAGSGECERNPDWMRKKCARSCRTCCRNAAHDSWCDWWASEGECKINPWWMKENCAESCHSCCENVDADLDCDWWTNQGECDANPGYMQWMCAKSCGTCRVLVE